MKHESYELAEFKAVTDGPKRGLFAALVSVFNNVDRNGDRVMPGAFTKSISDWRASGKPIPVVWSHEHRDPEAYIGAVDPQDMRETKDGLVVAGRLDIEDNPKAAKIYDLLAAGRLKEWSFAYEVKQEAIGKDLARELTEVNLFEVGPTLVGANPEVRTLAMKAAVLEEPSSLEPLIVKQLDDFGGDLDALIESKIGRAISTKTEARIRAALAELTTILSSLDTEDAATEEQKSSTPEPEEIIPEPPREDELLRRGLTEVGVFLSSRR